MSKDLKIFWFNRKDILSGTAKWATALSPYTVPNNLEIVLNKLADILAPEFVGAGVTGALGKTYYEIKDFIRKYFEQIPEITAWNDKKDPKSDGPDGDFIDITAVIISIANDIVSETVSINISEEILESRPVKYRVIKKMY